MNQPATPGPAATSRQPPASDHRWNEGLELARASAIALVVFAHGTGLLNREPLWRWLYDTSGIAGFFTPGWWGVRLFFALSGYLIGRQVIDALSEGGVRSALLFGLRRWFRTIPTYWLILGLFCLWKGLSWLSPAAVINALFLQVALPGQATMQVIEVGWSLAIEEWSYVALTLVLLVAAWLGQQPSRRQAARLLLAVTFTITALSVVIRIWGSFAPWMDWGTLKKTTTFQLDSLAVGMGMACFEVLRPSAFQRLCRQHRVTGPMAVLGMSLMGGWLNAVFRSGAAPSALEWALLGGVGYPIASLLSGVFLLAIWQVRISSWPAILLRPVRLLATTSYSLYLVHLPIAIAFTFHWLEWSGWAAFTVYAGASIVLGLVSWWLFEQPFLGIRQRLRQRSA